MMRKLLLLTAIILSLSLFLTGCGQKDIGEAKAKEIGLAFINQVFDVNETEATVEYQEHAGETYEDGSAIQYGSEEPNKVYIIQVNKDESGNAVYYAGVNAETGVAYHASIRPSSIALIKEQQKKADIFGSYENIDSDTLEAIQQDSISVAIDMIKSRLDHDVPIFRIYPDTILTDKMEYPKVFLEYIAIMENDSIYSITLCWPSMDLVTVNIRNFDS